VKFRQFEKFSVSHTEYITELLVGLSWRYDSVSPPAIFPEWQKTYLPGQGV
jgi:hypothetical protein